MDWVESLPKALCRSTSQEFFLSVAFGRRHGPDAEKRRVSNDKAQCSNTGPCHFYEVTDA